MGLNIRPIEVGDRHILFEMARAMHAESPRYRKRRFVDAKVMHLVDHLLKFGGGFAAELDGVIVGMVGGFVNEFFFSDERYFADLVLYVNPDQRGGSIAPRLVKALEKWGFEQQGVVEGVLGVSTGINMDRTVCMYEKLGYKMASTTLLKDKEDVRPNN